VPDQTKGEYTVSVPADLSKNAPTFSESHVWTQGPIIKPKTVDLKPNGPDGIGPTLVHNHPQRGLVRRIVECIFPAVTADHGGKPSPWSTGALA
jgi:hypothetical protein